MNFNWVKKKINYYETNNNTVQQLNLLMLRIGGELETYSEIQKYDTNSSPSKIKSKHIPVKSAGLILKLMHFDVFE